MLARTRLKLKNAESSISFMQEQHAKTLEDLHKEIEKLQKKNARLTFELTMNGSKTTSGQLKIEEELISEIAKVQSLLSKEKEKVALLQHQVDHLLVRHSEDTTARDDTINQLNNELDAKANVLTLVTQQLYQARARLKQEVEARSKMAKVCACPHCYVHRKTARSVSLSSVEGGLGPLRESPSCHTTGSDIDSGTSVTDISTGKWVVPPQMPLTTPISPHPPPSPAGRNVHSIKRRASTPVRRNSSSPKSSLSSSTLTDHAHYTHPLQRPLRPARATKDIGPLSCDLQRLLSLKGDEVTQRESHPILPPIISPTQSPDDQSRGIGAYSSVVVDTSPHPRQIPGVSGPSSFSSPRTRHRRLILAKTKGLSSAPSTLRVLHYSPSSRPQDLEEAGWARGRQSTGVVEGGGMPAGPEGEEEEEEGEGLDAPEGTLLLLKETDQKGTVGPQWATTEGDTCT